MLKYFYLAGGIILLVLSTIKISGLLYEYAGLSEYDKGKLWGNGILFLLGIFLLYLSMKKKR